jgi:UDP-N-acetylglucosamine 4,6-dehydratase/5-epimerase
MLAGNVLITGGTGSLGHAIVRRATAENWPCKITIFSRSELLQSQMRGRYPDLRYILGDVRDAQRVSDAIAGHDVVIHAAAMKRIPECEAMPTECYATNVQGSLNVLRACVQHGVGRVVGISTDKACKATTAYGASKLAMEKAFQATPEGRTIATCVRYGNVVASRGSVIPIWREQAARGEPLTITDYGMTRFWMGINGAVDLVLVGAEARHGEIWVVKMQALPVPLMAKIIVPDAQLKKIGLRSDEKLHEDLVHEGELVGEYGRWFIINPRGEQLLSARRGMVYSSDMAPGLTADEFRAMLTEGEAL